MIIQELKPSQHVQGRYLAVLEDGSIVRVGENEVISFCLYAGKELSQEETEALLCSVRMSAWKEKALGLLTRKPQSRRELERKLGEWGAGEQACAEICTRLEELGYLNDAAYAETVVRHYSAKGYGVRKLRDELYRRGVPRQLWEDALAQAQDSAGAIDAFVAKKLSGKTPDPSQLKKVSDALARRGYSWGEISQALERYGAETGEDY